MNDFVAKDLNIFFIKDFFGLNPSSADNRPLYSVPLLMNHPVSLKVVSEYQTLTYKEK